MPSRLHRPYRVFLVEDDVLVAEAITDALAAAGMVLVGWAIDPISALAWLDSGMHLDLALLDIGLPGGSVYPIADRLRERHIPTLFTSGADPGAIPAAYRDIPLLEKPFGFRELIATIAAWTNSVVPMTTGSDDSNEC